MLKSLQDSLKQHPENPFLQGHVAALTSVEEEAQARCSAATGSRPALRLDVAMLKQLLELIDHEDCEGELEIEWWETPRLDEEPQSPGYYAIMTDYPEHGGFPVMTFPENVPALAQPDNQNQPSNT